MKNLSEVTKLGSGSHMMASLEMKVDIVSQGREMNICYDCQGSHRLEKYLNIEGFLKKSLKTKTALKSTGESLQGLESP